MVISYLQQNSAPQDLITNWPYVQDYGELVNWSFYMMTGTV